LVAGFHPLTITGPRDTTLQAAGATRFVVDGKVNLATLVCGPPQGPHAKGAKDAAQPVATKQDRIPAGQNHCSALRFTVAEFSPRLMNCRNPLRPWRPWRGALYGVCARKNES
jgi:hypothetical protein